MVISRDPRVIEALHTTLNLQALYDMIEVILVDTHNARLLEKLRARNKKK